MWQLCNCIDSKSDDGTDLGVIFGDNHWLAIPDVGVSILSFARFTSFLPDDIDNFLDIPSDDDNNDEDTIQHLIELNVLIPGIALSANDYVNIN